MCLDIIDGISVKINEYFGDDYKIYSETVEQGLSLPCFFINHEETVRKKLLGERYLTTYSFLINYFPQNNKEEMIIAAEKLTDCLRLVEMPDGDTIRGKGIRFNITNGVLQFYISFTLILTANEEHDIMDSIDYRII